MESRKRFRESRISERRLLRENGQDVRTANSRMLCWLLAIGGFSFGLLLLVTFLADEYMPMRLPYICILLLLLFVFLAFKRLGEAFVLPLLYMSYGLLMGVVTYSSSFLTPDFTSVLVVMLLFQIPIVILDRSSRIQAVELLFAVVYMGFMIGYKDRDLVLDECVNAVIAGIFGNVLGNYLRRAQVDNFDLKRLAVLRENTDSLTGLGSRRRLFEYLKESEKAGQGGQVTGILMMDIDNFKAFNDTYGHQAGDDCLRKVGQVLLECGKLYGVSFYRYGGEEFVGVAQGLEGEELLAVCQEVAFAVWRMQIPHQAAKFPYVSISVGLARVEQPGLPLERLIHQSDTALYAAKGSGKNKVLVYTPDMEQLAEVL